MVDAAFGHWLAGFIDGEGSFNIRSNSRHGYVPVMSLTLRIDDLPMLEEIHRVTGIGVLERYKKPGNRGQASSRWNVAAKADCVRLVQILDRYPLRSKKARDYAIWREAVMEWSTMNFRGWRPLDWSRLIAFKRALEDVRRFDPSGVVGPPPDLQMRIEATS